jgi:hypothetical protein
LNLPLDALNTIILEAQTLIAETTAHADDFQLILENGIVLKERMHSIDWATAQRGDSDLLHFLHAPLNIVLAYSDLILEQPDPALTAEQLARVKRINRASEDIDVFILQTLE